MLYISNQIYAIYFRDMIEVILLTNKFFHYHIYENINIDYFLNLPIVLYSSLFLSI